MKNSARDRVRSSFQALSCLAVCFLSAGCINAAVGKPCTEAPAGATADAAASPAAGAGTPVAAGALKACAGAPVIAADGLIDDFEDGNTQLFVALGRDGFWWTHHDPNGSTLEPAKLAPEDGGADGSKKALRVHGVTSSEKEAYGSSVGVNFSKAVYDGSAYVGISFKAKVGPNSTKKVRFKIGDVNTHGQLGSCKSCWNHFGVDLELSTEWKEYKILFADAKQAVGWGDPRPPNLTSAQLAALDWTIGPGATYDLSLDDVQFLGCAK